MTHFWQRSLPSFREVQAMRPWFHSGRSGEAGQAIVLMTGALIAVLVAVALTVDGGNAWAQQRITQNGSDAAAEAGAVVMAEMKSGAATPGSGWDGAVSDAVQSNASANGITVNDAYYTDICGIPLQSDGSAALNADGTMNLSVAAQVGSGMPPDAGITPDCPSLSVGPPAGVLVLGHKDVSTFVAGVVGIRQIGVDTRATAVSGYLQGVCDASQGEACALLPVAIPVNITTCDVSGDPIDSGATWPLNQLVTVPLCKQGPGNVGWILWDPAAPVCGGGTPGVICEVENPNNPSIDLPSWQQTVKTGQVDSAPLQTALQAYDGQVVLIPQVPKQGNCKYKTGGPDPDSSQPAVVTPPDYGCPFGFGSGVGSNMWYYIQSFAYFQLCSSADADCAAAGYDHGAYTNGTGPCADSSGSKQCLTGKFVKIIGSGTVGPGIGASAGNNPAVGVQLIK